MTDDLTGLGPRGFERLCRALAACVLGPGIEAFGAGPDGGREASFCGLQQYPSPAAPWDRYGILQAKYKERLLGSGGDTAWLRRQVKAELDAWSDPGKKRVLDGRCPEYLIFATNVPLSAVPGRGGRDRISSLISGYATALGLKDWKVWDAAQISMFLDAYPQVRRAFAALITPSEVLAEMRDQLGSPPEVSVVLNMPDPVIRPGQPGCEEAFIEVYAAAGGAAVLGQALGEVREEGPGWVQHFSGPPGGETTVICACSGRPAVAVSGTMWRALAQVGGGHPGGGTAGAGLPVAARPPGPLIGPSTQEIELAGGRWGHGRYVRQGPDQWEWQPDIAFDSEACRDRDAWAGRDGDMDLRLRVAARIPVADSDLRVSNASRARTVAALRASGLNTMLAALAIRYGLSPGMLEWAETPEPTGINNSRFAAYQVSAAGSGGRVALLGSAWFGLQIWETPLLAGSHTDAGSALTNVRVANYPQMAI